MNIDNITGIINIIINRKFVDIFIYFCFFMLLAVKFFKLFPKHEGYYFISESFALN